jgi:hypothetical protein
MDGVETVETGNEADTVDAVEPTSGGDGGLDDDLAGAVLGRLRRIDRLRTLGAPTGVLLNELRALVPEAEAWAISEGDRRAQRAAEKLREGAEGMR